MAFFCRLGRYYARLHGIAPTSSLWFDIREIQNYQMEQSRPLHAQFPHPNITPFPIWYKMVLWWNLSRVYCMVRWSGVHLNVSWMSTQEFPGPPLQCLWIGTEWRKCTITAKEYKTTPLGIPEGLICFEKGLWWKIGLHEGRNAMKSSIFSFTIYKGRRPSRRFRGYRLGSNHKLKITTIEMEHGIYPLELYGQ